MNGDAAQQPFGQLQRVLPFLGDVLQTPHGFARDFGADPVTGQNQNVEIHEF